MKKRLIALLIICSLILISCACKPPKIDIQERCTIVLDFNYGTQQEIDKFFQNIGQYRVFPSARKNFLQDVLSIFGKARCHEYDLMTIKRVSNAYDEPLYYGNDVTGFKAKAWLKDITPWAKESKRYYEDVCKKK